MKTIIVPIDFSDFSNKIVRHAIDYAKKNEAKIYLLHVASKDIGFVIGDIGFQYLQELEKTSLEEDVKQLQQFQKMIEAQNLSVDIILKQGEVAELILAEAEALNADLIIIGSHGRSAFYEVLIGSVCHDVLSKTKKPLLIIPFEYKK